MKKIINLLLMLVITLSLATANNGNESNFYSKYKQSEQLEAKTEINDKLKQLVVKYQNKGYGISYHE